MSADRDTARRVKAQIQQRLLGDSRLRGVGIAPVTGVPGAYAVVVRVGEAAHVLDLDLPATVDGVPVTVTAVGDIAAL